MSDTPRKQHSHRGVSATCPLARRDARSASRLADVSSVQRLVTGPAIACPCRTAETTRTRQGSPPSLRAKYWAWSPAGLLFLEERPTVQPVHPFDTMAGPIAHAPCVNTCEYLNLVFRFRKNVLE